MIAKAALFVNRSLNFDEMRGIWWGNKEGVGRETLYNAALCQGKQEMMRGGFTRLGKPKAKFRQKKKTSKERKPAVGRFLGWKIWEAATSRLAYSVPLCHPLFKRIKDVPLSDSLRLREGQTTSCSLRIVCL
jgi:hypothetical protein